MRRLLEAFSRQSSARKVAVGALGIGILAVCVFGVLHSTGGATAATPSPQVGVRYSVFQSKFGQPAQIGTDRGQKAGHVKINGVRFYDGAILLD